MLCDVHTRQLAGHSENDKDENDILLKNHDKGTILCVFKYSVSDREIQLTTIFTSLIN